jgi:PST family polysaccharide transporter
LGIYQGTHKIVMAIMMLTSMPINVALFPRISKKFDESFRDGWTFFKKSFVVVLLFSLSVSLLTFLFSDFFVDVFFKKGCEDAYTLMKMFSILPFFVTLASLLTVQGLYGMQIQYMAPFVGGFLGVFSIGLNYVMLYRMGILGAAISWIICQFFEIVLVGMLILVKKSKKI